LSWFWWALAAAFANAVAGTLAKAGLEKVRTTLATAIAAVILATLVATYSLSRGDARELGSLDRKAWLTLAGCGASGAVAYLLYFRALDGGESARVQPVDRLSLVFAVILAVLFLKEKLNVGLVAGAVLMAAGAAVIALTAARG
jgi:transporter family protein